MKILFCIFLLSASAFATTKGKPQRSVAQEVKVIVEDSVRKIMPQGTADKIIFNKHAGIYYLRADAKHYEAIKAALKSSQSTGETVQVRADATSLEIEEIILGTK